MSSFTKVTKSNLVDARLRGHDSFGDLAYACVPVLEEQQKSLGLANLFAACGIIIQMIIQPSHIGEKLISEMFNRSEKVQHLVISKTKIIEKNLVAVPELALSPCGRYKFDGVHKVDICLLSSEARICIGIEAKLGLDRLAKKTFEDRFLKRCKLSHNDKRIAGSMIAILDRRLPEDCANDRLHLNYDKNTYELSKKWILIIRKAVLESWMKVGNPSLSENCSVLEFEELASSYGSSKDFNELVKEIIEGDYHQAWFEE